jgi:hypothetical protein
MIAFPVNLGVYDDNVGARHLCHLRDSNGLRRDRTNLTAFETTIFILLTLK